MLHGDAHLAQAAGADGVHLSARGNCVAARAIVGPRAMIGLSIHSIGETAHLRGADYAIVGPVFATRSKPGYGRALGRAGLSAITKASSVPVIAIGGITVDTVPEVMASGASGIAVMGGVMRADNPKAEVWGLIAALKASRV
jgi:thiamine-phosphate pyrophosphorylase